MRDDDFSIEMRVNRNYDDSQEQLTIQYLSKTAIDAQFRGREV